MLKKWSFIGSVLVAGCLVVAHDVQADLNRLFELRIYHTVPGKLPVMESRFRDTTSKILARHHLDVIAYWTGEDEKSFVFLLAHNSKEEAKRNWEAAARDPEFREIVKAEEGEKTLDRAEVLFMRPTDFSLMK